MSRLFESRNGSHLPSGQNSKGLKWLFQALQGRFCQPASPIFTCPPHSLIQPPSGPLGIWKLHVLSYLQIYPYATYLPESFV